MPINASPHYLKAEAEYLQTQGKEQKIKALKKMISLAPKHKSAENLLKQLRTRLAKLKYSTEKEARAKKGHKEGIKKEDMQATIIGFTNTGKSFLLKKLTNAKPKSSKLKFETKKPLVGMMPFGGTQIQLIENPAIDSENYDTGITNSADTLLILITEIEQIKEIGRELENATKKRIILFNNINKKDKRKIEATLKSKKYNFVILDYFSKEELEELKSKLFITFKKIRIYTKEPHKEPDWEKPIVLEEGATIKRAAEKLLKKGIKLKSAKVTGPSSKFPNQEVGQEHVLKDKDVVEFKTA